MPPIAIKKISIQKDSEINKGEKMKIVSIKGNKVTMDLNEDERNTLLRNGLQLWIDENYGKNKVKVVDPQFPLDKKPKKTFEIPECFEKECIQLAFNNGLRNYVEGREKSSCCRNENKKCKNHS